MSEIILKTTIRSSDVYQRQQGRSVHTLVLFHPVFMAFPCSDTLIVWTEPDGVDFALSFQDPEGCMELWNFILEVQSLRANSGGACHILLALSYRT
jgi:protein phosphatase-4 regulatory subunit 3